MTRPLVMDDPYSVSVVMPTYNRKERSADIVHKLLHEQDYDPSLYEVVVVDDGSTDGTFEHFHSRFADEIRQGRLTVLRQENAGTPTARNAGIAVARGNYIARMDDDDTPLSNRLRDSIDYFRQRPDRRIVHAKSYWVDEDGSLLHNGKNFRHGLNAYRERLAREADLDERTEELLLERDEDGYKVGRNVVHGGTTLAHRSLYEEIAERFGSVYDPATTKGEDKQLWMRIAHLAHETGRREFGFLDKIVANYTFTRATAKKEVRAKARLKDLNGYIEGRLNGNPGHLVVFAEDRLDDQKFHDYLHKLGRRSYREGKNVTFVLSDAETGGYRVRRLDTDVVMKKKRDFFQRRMHEYGSLEELVQREGLHTADAVEVVEPQSYSRPLPVVDGEMTVTFLAPPVLQNGLRELLRGVDGVKLHTSDNGGFEHALLLEIPELAGRTSRWQQMR